MRHLQTGNQKVRFSAEMGRYRPFGPEGVRNGRRKAYGTDDAQTKLGRRMLVSKRMIAVAVSSRKSRSDPRRFCAECAASRLDFGWTIPPKGGE